MLTKYERPDSFFGKTWEGYFVFLGQNRDSDCLTRSNFIQACQTLRPDGIKEGQREDPQEDTILKVCGSHWACGWIEWIAIHESDKEALALAETMQERLESYPVLNEEHFSELEQEEADSIWKNCYSWQERIEYVRKFRDQFDFHNWQNLLSCIKGEYFAGYASELIY